MSPRRPRITGARPTTQQRRAPREPNQQTAWDTALADPDLQPKRRTPRPQVPGADPPRPAPAPTHDYRQEARP